MVDTPGLSPGHVLIIAAPGNGSVGTSGKTQGYGSREEREKVVRKFVSYSTGYARAYGQTRVHLVPAFIRITCTGIRTRLNCIGKAPPSPTVYCTPGQIQATRPDRE